MFERYDMGRLNSMTKYPSIPTYHEMNKDGTLSDICTVFPSSVYGTEKVDGTNARIIVTHGDWVIGSREELLAAKGDRVPNMDLRIVEALERVAKKLAQFHDSPVPWCFFFEVFGHEVGAAAKNYAKQPEELGFRLFDVQMIGNYDTMMGWHSDPLWSREKIAQWRDRGGQGFATVSQLEHISEKHSLDLVPMLFIIPGEDLPTSVPETLEFMKQHIEVTRVALNPEARLNPEGIVLRTAGRRSIAKLRFHSYEYTMRKRGHGGSL